MTEFVYVKELIDAAKKATNKSGILTLNMLDNIIQSIKLSVGEPIDATWYSDGVWHYCSHCGHNAPYMVIGQRELLTTTCPFCNKKMTNGEIDNSKTK